MLPTKSAHELRDHFDRLHYCIEPLLGLDTYVRGYIEDRAFASAGHMLGISAKLVRSIVRSCAKTGGIEAFWNRRLFKTMPSARLGVYGYVYQARLIDKPWIIKIGFSANPDRRMHQLGRSTGYRHGLEDFASGSVFDETREFLCRRGDHIGDEYFGDRAVPVGGVPEFLRSNLAPHQWRAAFASTEGSDVTPLHAAYSAMTMRALAARQARA